MKIAIAAFTRGGAELAEVLREKLLAEGQSVSARVSANVGVSGMKRFSSVSQWTAEEFDRNDALLYIGATGIAVRAIAPHLRSKLSDPAVLALDEKGRYVVSLVSGHIGGANSLARHVAFLTGGTPVISTATDVNRLFAVDEWIARSGMTLRNAPAVRAFATALLEGREVGLLSELPIEGALPSGVTRATGGPVGLYVGVHASMPFAQTVGAVPRCLTLGIGCRRGTPESALDDAVRHVLDRFGIHRASIEAVASIDLKKDEAGLLAFCEKRDLPIRFYTAEALRRVETKPGEPALAVSEFVRGVTGVDNVCERAALLGGGKLLIRKQIHNGVTVAAAMRTPSIRLCKE